MVKRRPAFCFGPFLTLAVLTLFLHACGSGASRPDSGNVVDSGSDVAMDAGHDLPQADLPPSDSIDASAADIPADAPVDGETPDSGDIIAGPDDSSDPIDSSVVDLNEDDSDVADPACTVFDDPVVLSNLEGTVLNELSGLAASRIHEGVLWAHNDSGDSARIFAVVPDPSQSSGPPLITPFAFDSEGQTWGCFDWEDIAVGPFGPEGASHIFVADSGGNGCKDRTSYRLFIVAEPPVLAEGTISEVTVVTYVYPDGPHDCEAVFVDPVDGSVYFVVKEERIKTSGVYRLSAQDLAEAGTDPVTATLVATIPGQLVTGADMSEDGRMLVIRNYGGQKILDTLCGGLLFERGDGESVADMLGGTFCLLPGFSGEPWIEIQGEAIAISSDGAGLLTAPEYILGGFVPQLLRFWPFSHSDRSRPGPFSSR